MALVQDPAVKARDDYVMVRRARRDPVVGDSDLATAAVNASPGNTGPLSVSGPVSSTPGAGRSCATNPSEGAGHPGRPMYPIMSWQY
jgi:hypothetical protein